MINKIFRTTSYFIFSILITCSTFLAGTSSIAASQMSSDIDEDNPMGIVIEESNDDKNKSIANAAPDLGDDQAFPFIPGFGKNSGKD